MIKTVFEIRCKENGDYITWALTLEEANEIVDGYAESDMLESLEDGEAKKDSRPFRSFYEIVEVDSYDYM